MRHDGGCRSPHEGACPPSAPRRVLKLRVTAVKPPDGRDYLHGEKACCPRVCCAILVAVPANVCLVERLDATSMLVVSVGG